MDHSISTEDQALIDLVTAKAKDALAKLKAHETKQIASLNRYSHGETLIVKMFIDCADMRGVVTSLLTIPVTYVGDRVVFDDTVPEIGADFPFRYVTPLMRQQDVDRLNGGRIDIIYSKVDEHDLNFRPADGSSFRWMHDALLLQVPAAHQANRPVMH